MDDEKTTDEIVRRIQASKKTFRIHVGPLAMIVGVVIIATVLLATWHLSRAPRKLSADYGPAVASGGTAQSVGRVSPVTHATSTPAPAGHGNAPAGGGAAVSTCNGKQVDPSATGCTANGGVLFANPPQILNSQGQDTNR